VYEKYRNIYKKETFGKIAAAKKRYYRGKI